MNRIEPEPYLTRPVFESMESRRFLSGDFAAGIEVDAARHVRHRMFAIVDRTQLQVTENISGAYAGMFKLA